MSVLLPRSPRHWLLLVWIKTGGYRACCTKSGRPAHHGRPSLPAAAHCCDGPARSPSSPAHCYDGPARSPSFVARRSPASVPRCSHGRTLVTSSGLSPERPAHRNVQLVEHDAVELTACRFRYLILHAKPTPDFWCSFHPSTPEIQPLQTAVTCHTPIVVVNGVTASCTIPHRSIPSVSEYDLQR